MTLFAVNNANIFWSPANWVFNGSVYAQTQNMGAYFKTKFVGTECVINLDQSNATIGIFVAYSIDGGAIQYTAFPGVLSTTTSVTVATGLTDTTHTLKVWYRGMGVDNLWTTPLTCTLRITGITVNGVAPALSAPVILSKRWIIYGDSIVGGWNVHGSNYFAEEEDATNTWAQQIAISKDAEVGIVGFGQQGWGRGGLGGVVPFHTPGDATNTTWDKQYAGLARSFTGIDTVVINHGTNDFTFDDSGVQARVSNFLTAIRATLPAGAKIYLMIPFNGNQRGSYGYVRPQIICGFNDYQVATPDANCVLVDLGIDGELLSTQLDTDLLHPTQAGHDQLATNTLAHWPPRPYVRLLWPNGVDRILLPGGVSGFLLAGQSGPPITGYTITAAGGSFSFTGQAARTLVGKKVTAALGTFALTGQAASLKKGYPLIAQVGGFNLVGQVANLRATRKVPSLVGSFLLIGNAAALSKGRRITADSTAFVMTGRTVNLLYGRKVVSNSGVFIFTGVAANFLRTLKTIANVGTFSLTGIASRGLYGYRLLANVGSFSLVGISNRLLFGHRVAANLGAFTLTPVATTILRRGRFVTASPALYVMTGIDARLLDNHRLASNTGAFAFTGLPAGLIKGVFYNLLANLGTFNLIGQAALFRRTYKIVSNVGTFSLIGQTALSRRTYKVVASQGSFALTGRAALLNHGFRGVLSPGSFALTGRVANFLYGRTLKANSGIFTILGIPDQFLRHYRLHADSGLFGLIGQDANLVYSPLVAAILEGEISIYPMFEAEADFYTQLDGEISTDPMLTAEVVTSPG